MTEEYKIGQKKAVINYRDNSITVYHLNGTCLGYKKYSTPGGAKFDFSVWAEWQRLLHKSSVSDARYFYSK